MPIYSYRCSHCGHAQDALQKMSDAPLTHCPACGHDAYVKQLTAAGFQLKGTGWYATDFSGRKSTAPGEGAKPDAGAAPATTSTPAETTKSEAPAAAPASAAATSGA